jgi:DNA-binding XRE family transcriptional regulator
MVQMPVQVVVDVPDLGARLIGGNALTLDALERVVGSAEARAQLLDALRARRIARGWTLKRAAAEAGICPATASNLERGRRNSTQTTLVSYAAALGVMFDWQAAVSREGSS